MLDGFLKPKFYSKCKTSAKLTKTRLDTIMKKRNAVQKFLKNDIADLLRSALDYNAYGRAEGLLVEQNMSSCYELIAKYIGCILDHVRDFSPQSDCPDGCKEAIPSLMYAAARFSDLPELRNLRTFFTGIFEDSLEPYLSKELVQKLRQDPPSKEMKIQLLRDLAQEFSIRWDSKALEQRLYSPPVSHELQGKAKYDPLNEGGLAMPTWSVQSSSDDETSTDNSSQATTKACSSSLGGVSEDDEQVEINRRSFPNRLVPPPYLKEASESNLKKKTAGSEALPEKDSNHNHLHEQQPVVQRNNKPIPRSVRSRPRNLPPGYDTAGYTTEGKKMAEKANDDGEERVLDRLLMHYSNKKQSPCYEECGGDDDDGAQNVRRTKSGPGVTTTTPLTVRRKSVPIAPEQDTTTTTRASSMATTLEERVERSTSTHVHPSLPDYDDLSARLAALRGT